MAARWGTGEEMLKACNTQMFSPVNPEEAEILQGSFTGSCLEYPGFNNGDALEASHGCLDPSILSIFEDSPTGEVKSNIDEESDCLQLLTALTELLDNVDDENLSPFDTLPDSNLFTGQKGQEHSPVRKFFTWSSSEAVFQTRQFPGKSLPRMQRASQQNSEGEEEEDGDARFSTPLANIDLSDEFDWCLPVSLEQDGESVPVTLSDLVKHMHPYCMTLCVEGEEGQEHILPERGLVLEVVDQGEHGEPILAIPDLCMPFSLTDSAENEQRVPENSLDKPEPEPEDNTEKAPPPFKVSSVENQQEAVKLCKGKKKSKSIKAPLVEQRVLRSSKVKEERHQGEQKKQQEEQKKKKVTFSPVLSSAEPARPELEHPTQLMTSEPQLKKHIVSPQAEAKVFDTQQENKPLEKIVEEEIASKHEPVSEQPICQPIETKSKPLSLQQYRLLRQQRKPDPVDKMEDHSTKWPKLPEAPKELPPLPCLPDPSPRDPRKTFHTPVKKDPTPEIMPAWHPRGPAAPPTPEALLVPPASLMASSKKPPTCKSTPESSPQLVQSSPQKTHPSSSVTQNTIHPETSTEIKHPAEVPLVLPTMSTTSVGSQSLNPPSQRECLQGNSRSAHVGKAMLVAPSKVSSRSPTTTTQVQSSNSTAHKPSAAVPAKRETEQVVLASVSDQAKNILPTNSKRLSSRLQPHVAPIAAQPFFSAQVQARVVELAEQMRMASSEISEPKDSTVELIESFTSEIGIEAADLTSLLEQFEESQSKEEPSVPEVCGRAATVGNSSIEQQLEVKALEKTRNHDLGSTAGLTPPATPPHQMWKPLVPVSLLGKTNAEVLKSTPNKAIQIEAKPLPSNKQRNKLQIPATSGQIKPFSLDHDYCLPPKEPAQNEVGSRWNVKQQPSIIIKTVELARSVQNNTSKASSALSVTEETQRNLSQPSVDTRLNTSVLVTPDASPNRPDSENSLLEANLNQRKSLDYSECSSRQYQQDRGRSKRRYRTRASSNSDSSSESSRSPSPPRKRYRSRHSSSRSSSSSRSRSRSSSRSFSPPHRRRYSYSSSRSRSWSRSRSRSRSHSSDSHGRQHWRSQRSPNWRSAYHTSQNNSEDTKRRKEKAIEERRVVYVGRICGSMTRKELKERFSFFGEIEECTVHFRENGDNYGFVTYYSTKDAFNAIENGSRLREQNELPFDLCFGGRRQFCKASYADLDSNQGYNAKPTKGKFDALDFDTLLKQAQRNLKR